MALPFKDVYVFIKTTDNVLRSVENRGSAQRPVVGNYKNSGRIRLWQAAGAVFMETTVRLWKISMVCLLHNTF